MFHDQVSSRVVLNHPSPERKRAGVPPWVGGWGTAIRAEGKGLEEVTSGIHVGGIRCCITAVYIDHAADGISQAPFGGCFSVAFLVALYYATTEGMM
jgi:hypothetical protein